MKYRPTRDTTTYNNNRGQQHQEQLQLLNEPSSQNPRNIFSTNYQDVISQLSAPARLGRHSTQQPNHSQLVA